MGASCLEGFGKDEYRHGLFSGNRLGSVACFGGSFRWFCCLGAGCWVLGAGEGVVVCSGLVGKVGDAGCAFLCWLIQVLVFGGGVGIATRMQPVRVGARSSGSSHVVFWSWSFIGAGARTCVWVCRSRRGS